MKSKLPMCTLGGHLLIFMVLKLFFGFEECVSQCRLVIVQLFATAAMPGAVQRLRIRGTDSYDARSVRASASVFPVCVWLLLCVPARPVFRAAP